MKTKKLQDCDILKEGDFIFLYNMEYFDVPKIFIGKTVGEFQQVVPNGDVIREEYESQ